MDHIVLCKKLKDEGLHSMKGIFGYCSKDNGEDHFEFVHHNVFAEDMNEMKMKYAKFGNVRLNNCVSLFA